LLRVRHGDYSKDEVLGDLDRRTTDLMAAIPKSGLPERPDYHVVNAWLSDTYRACWLAGPSV
jgi:hypothetical protein